MNMKTLTETSTFRVLSLLLCLCFFIPAMNVSASSLQADKFKVSGIVKDATGEPVIGASVVEKGTTNGTVTDLDGNFNLTVASNSTIVISFIGYSDQEYRISKDNTVLNVNLKEDTEMIDEVVVVGYGVQKKENLTGSVAAVNFKDVASMPVANTANMLQGRLPGVMLTNNGAQAGHDSPEIRIRGILMNGRRCITNAGLPKHTRMKCYKSCKTDQTPIILPIPIGLRKCFVQQPCTNTICL